MIFILQFLNKNTFLSLTFYIMTTSMCAFIMCESTSSSNFNRSIRCDTNIKSRSKNNFDLSRNLKKIIVLKRADILTSTTKRVIRFTDVSRLIIVNLTIMFWQLSIITRFLKMFKIICSSFKMSLSNNTLIFKSSTM